MPKALLPSAVNELPSVTLPWTSASPPHAGLGRHWSCNPPPLPPLRPAWALAAHQNQQGQGQGQGQGLPLPRMLPSMPPSRSTRIPPPCPAPPHNLTDTSPPPSALPPPPPLASVLLLSGARGARAAAINGVSDAAPSASSVPVASSWVHQTGRHQRHHGVIEGEGVAGQARVAGGIQHGVGGEGVCC